MIGILGFRRVVILLVLLALNAVVAAAWLGYLKPEAIKREREVRFLKTQIASMQGKMEGIRIDPQKIDQQKKYFNVMENAGFFSVQGRREAELILKEIQSMSGVNKAVIDIGKGEKHMRPEIREAQYVVLESPLKIGVFALDDLEIMSYMAMLQSSFPGHLTIGSLQFKRDKEINNTVLRAIAEGKSPDLVSGEVSLVWRTLIKDDSPEAVSQFGEGGW
ncbi:MAG: hypothetical protein ACRBCT_07315 [Alphaproteobacteria bacterium]